MACRLELMGGKPMQRVNRTWISATVAFTVPVKPDAVQATCASCGFMITPTHE